MLQLIILIILGLLAISLVIQFGMFILGLGLIWLVVSFFIANPEWFYALIALIIVLNVVYWSGCAVKYLMEHVSEKQKKRINPSRFFQSIITSVKNSFQAVKDRFQAILHRRQQKLIHIAKNELRPQILDLLKIKLRDISPSFKKIYAPDISEYRLEQIRKYFYCKEADEDILAVVDTTLSGVCDEGLVFTVSSFYIKNGYNEPESCRYDAIQNVQKSKDLIQINTKDSEIMISTSYYNKLELKLVLYKICAMVLETENYIFSDVYAAISDTLEGRRFRGYFHAGTVYGNVSTALTVYGYDKFSTPQGHGFAAERANHMFDKIRGSNAKILGDDNAANGADRSVNGILIQSKYCATGSKCIEECFNQSGNFRYYAPDGSAMQIEVPSDMYDDAVTAMQKKITDGKIKGVSDPAEAKNIVRQGNFTYQQAKNIAKAGNIDSIKFDTQNGIILGFYSGGVSAAISFAVSLWNGENIDDAVINAGSAFLKVGSVTTLTTLCVSQIARTGINRAVGDTIVKAIGPKASAIVVNSLKSGTNIYGAATMKSASKLIGGNVIAAGISTALLSTGDIINLFSGRISGKQLFKNLTVNTAGIIGGSFGWAGGAQVGAVVGSFIPGVGTIAGGIVGGIAGAFAGGSGGSGAAKGVLDNFIEDDAEKMVKIIQAHFQNLAGEFLVSKNEAITVIEDLKDILNGATLKNMYASSDRILFADDMMRPLFEFAVLHREKITLPNNKKLLSGIRKILENIA